jgi:hypothetical protein
MRLLSYRAIEVVCVADIVDAVCGSYGVFAEIF